MKFFLRFFVVSLILFALIHLTSPVTRAATFDLSVPSGALQRDQDFVATITINTLGTSVTSIQTGLTYDTQYLQFVSVAPGAAMNSVVADSTTQGTGKVLLTGTNNTGFNGTGVFATVTFKLIAQSPGSTEICTLWTPTESPTPAPSCNNSCTSNSQCPSNLFCYIASGQSSGYCRMQTCPDQVSCSCPQPTGAPVPTALPQTGVEDMKNMGVAAGGLFITAAGTFYFLSQRGKYVKDGPQATHKKAKK